MDVVCLSACLSLANDSSEIIKVTIMKLGTVTPSDIIMHHVLIILTLTFIQGHTDLNHENEKCSIISETVQQMLIKSAVKIVRLCNLFQSDDRQDSPTNGLHSKSQVLRLNLGICLIYRYYNNHISDSVEATAFKLGMPVEVCIIYTLYMLMHVPMTMTLMKGHNGSPK